MTHC